MSYQNSRNFKKGSKGYVNRARSYAKNYNNDDRNEVDEFEFNKETDNYDNDNNVRVENLKQNKSNGFFNESLENSEKTDKIDTVFEFSRFLDSGTKLGWLVNMHPILLKVNNDHGEHSGLDLYFIERNGSTFKSTIFYKPYFYVFCKEGTVEMLEEQLKDKFQDEIYSFEYLKKEDLALPNHVTGQSPRYALKLSFRNNNDLSIVKKFLQPLAFKNEEEARSRKINSVLDSRNKGESRHGNQNNQFKWDCVTGLREFDVPYVCRVAMDLDIRVGVWYDVEYNAETSHGLKLNSRPDIVKRADPIVLAFDIETTKLPLKFPDSSFDQVMMISYMVDGIGYLITNRSIVSEDVADFEYNPMPGMEGPFTIFNEPDEKAVLFRFFEQVRDLKPTVIVTYNGDFFDWPFVEKRAATHNLDMFEEIGFMKDNQGEYKSSYCIHMDCFAWVKRDSYLPAGSHGLKAVSAAKLGYNPLELNPEEMTPAARDRPQELAQYSVSDAVATYYLYMKYVHPFIFSLCNLIPANADDVLRKGSGTLCEYLLMVQAFKANVVMPNKYIEPTGKLYNGHMLETETYVGGHVEALEAGVFRSDIPTTFNVKAEGVATLIDQLDEALRFSLKAENKVNFEDVENYDEVYQKIKNQLLALKTDGPLLTNPLIYHLDVGAMYPNIILTNRLQPDALVTEAACASCDFNRPGKQCDRRMQWSWRGDFYPANQGDLNLIKNQLNSEMFPGVKPDDPPRHYDSLAKTEQQDLLKKRLALYCRKVYNKVRKSEVVEREAIVCQRENPFYINTVRLFRDRRYEYKAKLKECKNEHKKALKTGDASAAAEAEALITVFDSLQLAHKCILNSFYGYVMRKGSRWYSMEMGGIVCLTGARIIQMARRTVDMIGRPLELDTDGIWCILPKGFPENFTFNLKNGKKAFVSYPCTMLNHLVYAEFTNHQYQDLVDPVNYTFEIRSENSIFFEVDGPYKAMILPASTAEDRLLKKRYAVFNHDGSLAELKGFEIKRRGELKMIKLFQTQLFSHFLKGTDLQSCYDAVAKVANRWLDILLTKGTTVTNSELFDLIAENRSMSKALSEYGEQRSTSISTARRLAEFLGDKMVQDKGLACNFIISRLPVDKSVSDRAIPTDIFFTEKLIMQKYLRQWTNDPSLNDFDVRSLLDWQYYLDRFGAALQKLITIPAAYQSIPNPIPRVQHPDWLARRVAEAKSTSKQHSILNYLQSVKKGNLAQPDMEDFGTGAKLAGIEELKKNFLPSKAIVRKRDKLSKDEILQEHLEKPKPSIKDSYTAWLAHSTKTWKLRRELKAIEAKRARSSNNSSAAVATINRSKLNKTFLSTMPYLFNSFHVLQVTKTEDPGILKLWIIVDEKLFNLKVNVPRILYVSCHHKDTLDEFNFLSENVIVTPSNYRLPRLQNAEHLYQLQMDEQFYFDNRIRFTNLSNHPNVGSVYGNGPTTIDQAVLSLGCISSISEDYTGSGLQPTFELKHFYRDLGVKHGYLNQVDLGYLTITHELHNSRHVFIVFASRLGKVVVIVVDDSPRPVLQLSGLVTSYQRIRQQFKEDFSGVMSTHRLQFPDQIEVETEIYNSIEKAYESIQKLLASYTKRKAGPTLLITHTPQLHELKHGVRSCADFPAVDIPYFDNEVKFPLIGWQHPVVSAMFTNLFTLGSFLEERITWASFANMPLGNLGRDSPLELADLFYARYLRRSQAVLWWSYSNHPDLGGGESDQFRHLIDLDLTLPGVNIPTANSTICLDLELEDLALNAVLNSHLIGNTDSNGALEFGKKPSGTSTTKISPVSKYGPNHKSHLNNGFDPQSFSVLKTLLRNWNEEALESKTTCPNLMVRHFFRWISNTTSRLYDRQLHFLVVQLMRQSFSELVSTIRDSGASIIYATPNRLVLGTSKVAHDSGDAFSTYIINHLTTMPSFRYLKLNVNKTWDRLIWMNPNNYIGITTEEQRSETQFEDEFDMGMSESADKGEISYQLVSKWAIADYLPAAIRPHFHYILQRFIRQLHNNRQEFLNQVQANPKCGDNLTAWREQELQFGRATLEEMLNHDIFNVLTQVGKSIKLARSLNLPSAKFPRLPGSPYYAGNRNYEPEVEWVKVLCGALTVDKRFADDIDRLKYDLFKQLHADPFSAEAKFLPPSLFQISNSTDYNTDDTKDPNHPHNAVLGLRNWQSDAPTLLKLPDIICSYCGYIYEVDFYANLKLSQLDFEAEEDRNVYEIVSLNTESDMKLASLPTDSELIVSQFEGLYCPRCHVLHNKDAVEQALLEHLQTSFTTYQVQDVGCSKCPSIQSNPIEAKCNDCSVSFINRQYKEAHFISYCKAVQKLATFHDLETVTDFIEFVLDRY